MAKSVKNEQEERGRPISNGDLRAPRMSKIYDEIICVASKDESITALYLFGSHARGCATAFSDIDIAVIHTDADRVNRAALNDVADRHRADVEYTYVESNVFKNDEHPLHVSSSIKKEGVLLWQR